MRRRSTVLQRIDGIIARALKKRQVPFQAKDRFLADTWEKAVGPQIASQSVPDSLRHNVLFVKVSSPVWMQQLHFLKKELIEKINALMENSPVKDIRFSIGQVSSFLSRDKDGVVSPPPINLLKERDKKMIEKCLASLKDKELKDILKRVMVKEITWRRSREGKAH